MHKCSLDMAASPASEERLLVCANIIGERNKTIGKTDIGIWTDGGDVKNEESRIVDSM